MLPIALLLLALGFAEGRPQAAEVPTFIGNRIIGGTDASPGEFPWQLSQQRQASGTWSHSCGSSLIDNMRSLSAAHCVDGTDVAILRVLAGLHDRSNDAGAQIANLARYVMHEDYNDPANPATYSNDIAILHFATAINEEGTHIRFATLAAANADNFAGQSCIITGWGRTSTSQVLPNVLQKAPITAYTTAACQATFILPGATVWDHHICFMDQPNGIGACNGDSGGPANCPDGSGGSVVAGITSWGTSLAGNCVQNRPSVYTRVSSYRAWIDQH